MDLGAELPQVARRVGTADDFERRIGGGNHLVVLGEKGAEGGHAIREVQGIEAVVGHRAHPAEDFFRGRQGGAAGATDDTDQL